MSQKTTDKTRRGRASTGAQAGAAQAAQGGNENAVVRTTNKDEDNETAPGERRETVEMVTVGSQTEQDGVLTDILKRLEKMDGKSSKDS